MGDGPMRRGGPARHACSMKRLLRSTAATACRFLARFYGANRPQSQARLCRTRRFRRVFAVCGSSSRFPSSERGTARAAGSVHQIKRRSKLAAQNAVETRQTWPVARGPDGRGLALRPIRAVALPPHSRGTAGRFAHVTELDRGLLFNPRPLNRHYGGAGRPQSAGKAPRALRAPPG